MSAARSERGQAAALSVLFLAVLLGMAARVLDIGSWYRADRAALDRILAEEFLGTDPAGNVQNKQQYLATIQPNTYIRSWDFTDLNLSRSGSNAVLTGVFVVHGQAGNRRFTQRYRFTDTFVWREGRWQAISSQVAELPAMAPPPSRRRSRDGGGNLNML